MESNGTRFDFVSLAKRSSAVHSTYKLVRDARTFPRDRRIDFGRLRALFKVLPNTMLAVVRLLAAYEAVLNINREGIPGDIVECGVWNGGCVGLMALANKANPGPQRSIQLFDSFEGCRSHRWKTLTCSSHFLITIRAKS